MKLTKIERNILIEVFKASNGLYLFTLHRQLDLSPKDLFLAIENLKTNGLIDILEDRVIITKEGIGFAVNAPLTLRKDIFDKKTVMEEFRGPEIKVNDFYIPQNFQK